MYFKLLKEKGSFKPESIDKNDNVGNLKINKEKNIVELSVNDQALKGIYEQKKEIDCVLVWDEDRERYVLEVSFFFNFIENKLPDSLTYCGKKKS
jgi:hypothetical protein